MLFTTPVNEARPPGASRFECWSPKLRRRISLYSQRAFDQWILLEADPEAAIFCERPYWAVVNGERKLVDFWVRREEGDHGLMLVAESASRAWTNENSKDEVNLVELHMPELRRVTPIDLMAKAQLIANWRMILPYLTANATFVTPSLLLDVEQAIATPMALGELEKRLQSTYELMLVRTGVFHLLHRGKAVAPSLGEERLGPRTVFGGLA